MCGTGKAVGGTSCAILVTIPKYYMPVCLSGPNANCFSQSGGSNAFPC